MDDELGVRGSEISVVGSPQRLLAAAITALADDAVCGDVGELKH
jgi:hypothetical protein